MHKIGIVPAAGVGARWGYYPKFLLPCGEREWLLDRTIRAMPCERVNVIYGDATGVEIANHIDRTGLNDKVLLRPNERMDLDFFGSMLAGMEDEADYYYFGMPDTYWPVETFQEMRNPGISLGVHYTDRPERFGMIRGGQIVNKQAGAPGQAWGLLGWDRDVRDLWVSAHLETYTEAINLAMQEFRVTTIPMAYYYDMATFADYAAFIRKMA